MTVDLAAIAADVLDRISSGADEEDIASALSALFESADPQVRRLHSQLVMLMQARPVAAMTEQALNLLIETTHDLSRTLSLTELLRTIVSRARKLVGANIAWVTILDEPTRTFRNVATEGNLTPGTAEMITPIDRGAVSVVMAQKTFFATQDYLSDQRFTHDPALDRQFRSEGIVSLAGFPILSEGNVQGLLFVAERHPRHYTGREVSVLGSFALHAGVAMRNARSFAQIAQALDETESSHRVLKDYIRRIESSAQIHDEMMLLLAQGANLASFMTGMASLIGGAIQYLDGALTIREEVISDAYVGRWAEELRRGRMDQARILSAVARSRENGRSALLQEDGEETCVVLALHGGSVRGDSLVVCHTGPIDEGQMRNLERSAVALSIAKLWNEKRETERLIASSTLLRHLALVSRPDEPTIASVRDRLALGAEQPVQIAMIVLSGLARSEQTALIQGAGARLNLLADLIDDAYLAIGSAASIRGLVGSLERKLGPDRAGGLISDAYTQLSETPQHYARISHALHAMRRLAPLNRFMSERDVTLFARLFEGADPVRVASFVRETLAPIEAREARARSQLKATLLCFFDCQFGINRTAEKLGIHVNTLRQRLEILRDVTGGWDNPVAALELHVALRLDHLTSIDYPALTSTNLH